MRRPHPVLVYTTSRLLMLCTAALVLYAVGARGWLLLLLAFVVSALLSYLLLYRQRAAVATALERRTTRARESMDERTRAEDEADEAWRAAHGDAAPDR